MKKLTAVLVLLLISVLIHFSVNAATNEDKVTIGDDVRIDRETSGSVVAVGGDIDIEKDIHGSVVSVFGNVTVNAKVSGDVVAVLGKVKLTDNAEIGGNLTLIGSLDKADKAQVDGQDVIINTGNIDIGDFHMGFSKFMSVLKLVCLISFIILTLLFGLPMLAIFSKTFKNASAGIEEKFGYKLSIGFLGLLGSLIITLLFSWTAIIPIIYFFVLIMAKVAASLYVGRVILNVFDAKLNRFMEFFTGFISIIVIMLIILLLLPAGGVSLFGVIIGWDIVLYFIFLLFINSLGLGILINCKLNKFKHVDPVAEK